MLGPLIAALVLSVVVGANIHHQDVMKQEQLKLNYAKALKKSKQHHPALSRKKDIKTVKIDGIEVANLALKEIARA